MKMELMKPTICSSLSISMVAKFTNITISPMVARLCACSTMPTTKIARMVMVVDARVITDTIAHHDSTGICAESSLLATLRRSCTSASMRTKLCTSATLPSASDARSARSE